MNSNLRAYAVFAGLVAGIIVGGYALGLDPFVAHAAAATDVAVAMAVVTGYGNGYKNPTSILAIDAKYGEGAPRTITSKISIANGDSASSIFYLGKVPSSALIDPRSAYYYTAITGLADLDIGFANDPDALVDGDDVSAAGLQTLAGHGTLTAANMTKKAWELAGYTSDPGGVLDVIATMKAAATAAGTITVALTYNK